MDEQEWRGLIVVRCNNFKDKLINLNFHDSEVKKVEVVTSNGNERKCILIIDYYNWENNKDSNSTWEWRELKITFNFLGQIEWRVSDFGNRQSDILGVEFDCEIDKLYLSESKMKEVYPGYVSPIFDSPKGFLSIKLNLSNINSITNEQGYLLIIGSGVELEWSNEECRQGKIHIPINSEF